MLNTWPSGTKGRGAVPLEQSRSAVAGQNARDGAPGSSAACAASFWLQVGECLPLLDIGSLNLAADIPAEPQSHGPVSAAGGPFPSKRLILGKTEPESGPACPYMERGTGVRLPASSPKIIIAADAKIPTNNESLEAGVFWSILSDSLHLSECICRPKSAA